jgi:hypothetical protein
LTPLANGIGKLDQANAMVSQLKVELV